VRLGRVRDPSNRLVIVEGGQTRDVGALFPSLDTMEEVIRRGASCWNELEVRARELPIIESDGWAAPLSTPSKVICVGLNYVDHALEQKVEHPSAPLIFTKFPSAIVGPGDPITWPVGLTQEVDYEAELAVIIGAQMRSVDEVDAAAGIFGYTVANDVSARDLQFADGQFTRGKSLDSFLPLGPVVVTADEFGDASGHRITARVNGETMQDSNTSELIFSVPAILSYLSAHATLYPGDIVLTGTPAGVGAFRDPPRFLGHGDSVEIEIEDLGILINPVRVA
jgi:2-keto-4-pentenoate hydratase/2-oxohepta-3-ene-1,7-dioic acid hydratase in catechol pathway